MAQWERLLAINDAYINGLPWRARYLAELMIRDYGTHVITRTELGAVIEQEDYVESNIREHQEIRFSEVRAAASASFLSNVGVFSGGISYSTQTYTKSKEHFENSLKHTQIKSRGGPNVNRLFSVEPGSNTSHLLVDDLVVIDRSGIPLFTMINEQTMRGYDHATITRISNAIRNATETYYRMNKIQGCMDPRAQNFDLRANVNGSCIASYHNDTIGGVYQKCSIVAAHEGDEYVAGFYPHEQQSLCANFTQKNGATGDFSCPDFHETIELFHGNIGIPHLEIPYCWQKCSTFNGGIFTKKHTIAERNRLFRQGQVNLFTGSAACPGYYQEYRVFRDTIVCLSRNYQADSIYEIKLDRFFSCQQPREDQRCGRDIPSIWSPQRMDATFSFV
ncbi:unnamed protein product, partial [Mesorhabditis belari]|uniref:MACPF domain-containing protein n=1 Tax=Mesorhabditis belari TaxID=2138241 RepID=A0AAF3F983_9BILA